MEHFLRLVAFFLMGLMSVMFALGLGMMIFLGRRQERALPSRLLLFYVLSLVGSFLATLADYRRAFGGPAGHGVVRDMASFAGLGVMGTGLWIARRPLGQGWAAFMAANGGTNGMAVISSLLHPNRSLARLSTRTQSQAPPAEPPAT